VARRFEPPATLQTYALLISLMAPELPLPADIVAVDGVGRVACCLRLHAASDNPAANSTSEPATRLVRIFMMKSLHVLS